MFGTKSVLKIGVILFFHLSIFGNLFGQNYFNLEHSGGFHSSYGSVKETQSGDIVCSGIYLNTQLSPVRLVVTKSDSAGNLQWTRSFLNANEAGNGTPKAIELESENLLIGSNVYDPSDADMTLMLLSSGGNPIWRKEYGGNGDDILIKTIMTSDSSILLCGRSTSYVPVGVNVDVNVKHGGLIYLVKVDTSGSVLWSHVYHHNYGGFLQQSMMPQDIVELDDGSFVIAQLALYGGAQNGSILRVSNSGNLIGSYEFEQSDMLTPRKILATPDGGYLVAADSSYICNLIKFNSQDQVQWSKKIYSSGTFPPSSRPSAIQLSGNGEIQILLGGRMIFGLDSLGNQLWEKQIVSSSRAYSDMDITQDQNLLLGGIDGIDTYALLCKTMASDFLLCDEFVNNEYFEPVVRNVQNLSSSSMPAGHDSSRAVTAIFSQLNSFTLCTNNYGPSFTTPNSTNTLESCYHLVCPDFSEGLSPITSTSIIQIPMNGSLLSIGDSCFEYTPNMGFIGLDSFSLEVCNTMNFCFSDFIVIDVLQAPELGPDTMLCNSDEILLSISPAFDQILWHNGSASSTFVADSAGTYSVFVTLGNCSASDSVYISHFISPHPLELPNDTTICDHDTLYFILDSTLTYTWHDGSTGHTYSALDSGLIWAEGWDGFCYTSDSMRIEYDTCLSVFDEFEMNNVNVYPNPFLSSFSVDLTNLIGDVKISIVDSRGRIVFRPVLFRNELVHFHLDLESGIYFLIFQSNTGRRAMPIMKE